MTMPANAVSIPAVPAQPDKDTYGPVELALFKTYTRESFRSAFGAEAPPYDPTRVIKTWFDSSVDLSHPSNVALYRIIAAESDGQWKFRQLVIPAAEAASVNLPGAVSYPPYVIAPTKATRGGAPLWADRLSLESEAQALLRELGIATPLEDIGLQWSNTAFPTLYGDEPRREWVFNYKDQIYNVGGLLKAKNEAGVGAPGHWVVGDSIEWIADPPAPSGLDDQRPPRPVPVRELLPNETLGQSLMGPFILRTDRRRQQAETAGQFTSADRVMLREIRDILLKLTSR